MVHFAYLKRTGMWSFWFISPLFASFLISLQVHQRKGLTYVRDFGVLLHPARECSVYMEQVVTAWKCTIHFAYLKSNRWSFFYLRSRHATHRCVLPLKIGFNCRLWIVLEDTFWVHLSLRILISIIHGLVRILEGSFVWQATHSRGALV